MNHGEAAAVWYLRLNGFFPLSNYVVHGSSKVRNTAECDVLAVRPPFVYEEIGGTGGDWDPFLTKHVDLTRTVGLICEVKSGDYTPATLFRADVVEYAVGRLGLAPQEAVHQIAQGLQDHSLCVLKDGTTIGKLLIARDQRGGAYLFLGLRDVEQFLRNRVRKFAKVKYRDRVHFGATLFQSLIELEAPELLREIMTDR